MANGAALATPETADTSWFAYEIPQPMRGDLLHESRVELPASHGTIEVTLSGLNADWVLPTLKALSRLCRLEQNWNSYGALPLQDDHLWSALKFIQYLSRHDIPTPIVVPTNQGGIQFEWELPAVEVEIRTMPNSRISLLMEGRAGQPERSDEISLNDPGRLLPLARELAHPAR